MSDKIEKTDPEWKKQLTPEQYQVLRKEGTERPFASELNKVHEHGIFKCAACDKELFSSDAKFDSGTGWPSFYQPISKDAVGTKVDKSSSRRGPKCSASAAAAISDTSSMTARSRRACAIA